MTGSPAQRRRGLAARLTAWLVVLGALPLMAPTCGTSGEGFKIFSRRSLIIPMDVCYQYQTDGVRTSYAPAAGAGCPNPDPGDVIKAYGLVYQLIRNGIAVYWVIDNAKTAVTGIDLTVEYAGGFPVLLFDWATGVEGAPPATPTGHAIDYRGGPFVVDGSDYARAAAILQSFRTTFGNVNVHVSNVAFRGYAKRTMAGGWSAGGAVPPKLALLDIGSSGAGSKNSEVVIQGYLTRAGLDTPGAAGTTAPARTARSSTGSSCRTSCRRRAAGRPRTSRRTSTRSSGCRTGRPRARAATARPRPRAPARTSTRRRRSPRRSTPSAPS